jgi:hypothetical protein
VTAGSPRSGPGWPSVSRSSASRSSASIWAGRSLAKTRQPGGGCSTIVGSLCHGRSIGVGQARRGASNAVGGPLRHCGEDTSCGTTVFMAKQTEQPRKRRGPKPTGKGEPVQVRLQPALMSAVDAWIASQDDELSRPEAMRRLAEIGLSARAKAQPMPQRSPKSALKASDMAAQQIDKLADPSATDEERQTRKRRLLKGPREFRDIRGGVPKPKR